MIALDFDAKSRNSSLFGDLSGPEAVARDVTELIGLVSPHGGRVIVDVSPTGGRHAYLVLSSSVPHHEVVPVLRALAASLPTLDVQPMLSVQGLIRPPGSRHASGGHQQLLTDLNLAARVAREGNPHRVWKALQQLTSPEQTPSVGPNHRTDHGTIRPGGLSAAMLAIARDGDTTAYPSPSEARQAVLTACARLGWTLTDVTARIEDGRWPGQAQLYAKYGRTTSRTTLTKEWRKANQFVKKDRARTNGHDSVRMQHKGAKVTPPTHTGYQRIRAWETATRICERTRWQDAPALILIVRALGQVAQRNATMTVDHGDRALSLATGLDIGTVSRGLARLRAEEDPVLERVLADRGHGLPDVYELRIPTELEQTAARRRWRPGQLHALRPCFSSGLGRTAGFVYEAIARSPGPIELEAVVDEVPYADSAVRHALAALEGWGLAHRGEDGWILGPATPDQVAERCGASERFEQRVTLYRRQRVVYRAIVLRRIPIDLTADPGDEASPKPPDPGDEPPPHDLHALGPPWAATRDQAWLARETTRADAVQALVDVLGAREVS